MLYIEFIFEMPHAFAKRNIIAQNETAIKHALHMIETEGSVALNIVLFCYIVNVHALFLCT